MSYPDRIMQEISHFSLLCQKTSLEKYLGHSNYDKNLLWKYLLTEMALGLGSETTALGMRFRGRQKKLGNLNKIIF